MHFDPENKIIRLCAEGMGMETEGKPEIAHQLFLQAWNEAANDFEKFTAAHYVARHQKSAAEKLKWDEIALDLALRIDDVGMRTTYPSLYLNIAKGYEDMSDFEKAKKNYELALSYATLLPDDGYGKMVRAGINNGINRIAMKTGS